MSCRHCSASKRRITTILPPAKMPPQAAGTPTQLGLLLFLPGLGSFGFWEPYETTIVDTVSAHSKGDAAGPTSAHPTPQPRLLVQAANRLGLSKGGPLEGKTLEEIVRASATDFALRPVFNNAAQAWNHDFYWKSLRPKGGAAPSGVLAEWLASEGPMGNGPALTRRAVRIGLRGGRPVGRTTAVAGCQSLGVFPPAGSYRIGRYPGWLFYTSPNPRDRTRSRMPSSGWIKNNHTK